MAALFDEGIQITNTESTTATKVNVQEANGEVNTQTIKTGFNKNIGLGGSDVVGANTLLNQYSTNPVDWTATAFNSGQVVFYAGKQWIAKMATVAGDVPAVSQKWEEITFEALANKTVAVDQTIIDGSTSAVSGNAVFDALATKAPISSVHNPVTLGTANGLSLATQQLSLGLASSSTTGALSGTDWNNFNNKQPTITGLTTNYLPKWNGSGFGDSGVFDDGSNIKFLKPVNVQSFKDIYFGDRTNAPYGLGLYFNPNLQRFIFYNGLGGDEILSLDRQNNNVLIPTGRILINKTDDDLTNQLQVAGTISASPATTANQVPTWGQVQAVAARPYKVYTALLTQTGTNAPTATVLENTLGGAVTWTRNSAGVFYGTLSAGLFTANKTVKFATLGYTGISVNATIEVESASTSIIAVATRVNGNQTDDVMSRGGTSIEIRIYN